MWNHYLFNYTNIWDVSQFLTYFNFRLSSQTQTQISCNSVPTRIESMTLTQILFGRVNKMLRLVNSKIPSMQLSITPLATTQETFTLINQCDL